MNETHLSVFHSKLTESTRETVSLPWLAMLSTNFFPSRLRDFTIFTLPDLTDFYVERVTVPHYNKCGYLWWLLNGTIHVFIAAGQIQNETQISLSFKISLRARGPPGVLGDLRSLQILHIGRIGSDDTLKPGWRWGSWLWEKIKQFGCQKKRGS